MGPGPCCCGWPRADTVVVDFPSLATDTSPPPLGFTRATFCGKVSVFPSIVLLSLSCPLISFLLRGGHFSIHRNYTPVLVISTSTQYPIVNHTSWHLLHVISEDKFTLNGRYRRKTKNGRALDKTPILSIPTTETRSTYA